MAMDCTTIQVFLSRVNVYIKVKYIGMVPVSFIFISVKYSEFNNLYNYVFIIHQPCNKYNVDKSEYKLKLYSILVFSSLR
jgi:hypothetical protein